MPDEPNNVTENPEQPKAARKSRLGNFFTRWWQRTMLWVMPVWPLVVVVGLDIVAVAALYLIGGGPDWPVDIFDIITGWTVNADSARYALSAIAQSAAALGALTFTALFIALQLFQGRYSTSIAPLLIRDQQLHMTVSCILIGILEPIVIIGFVGDTAFAWWLVAAGLLAGVAAIGATVGYVSWRIQRVNATSILKECGQQIDALAERVQILKHPETHKTAIGDLLNMIEDLGNGAIEGNRPQLLGDIFGWLNERYKQLRDAGAPKDVADIPLDAEERLLLKAAPDYSKFADRLDGCLTHLAIEICNKGDDENWKRILYWFQRMARKQDKAEDLKRTFEVLGRILAYFGGRIGSILEKVADPSCATEPVLSDEAFKAVAKTIHTIGTAVVDREYFDEMDTWLPKLFGQMLDDNQRLERAASIERDGQKRSFGKKSVEFLETQERMLQYFAGAFYAIAIDMHYRRATPECIVSYLQHIAGNIIDGWGIERKIRTSTFLEEVLLFFRDDGSKPPIEFPLIKPETEWHDKAYAPKQCRRQGYAVRWHLMLWSYLRFTDQSQFNPDQIPYDERRADMAPICKQEHENIPNEVWDIIVNGAMLQSAISTWAVRQINAKQAAGGVVSAYHQMEIKRNNEMQRQRRIDARKRK